MNGESTVQLPAQWSTTAASVDWVYYFVYWLSVVFFVAICAATLYFVVKYRRHAGNLIPRNVPLHNTVLEITWTIAPVFLLALLFHWGFEGFMNLRVHPANAFEIRVRAKKWLWEFEYPNGMHTLREMTVPVNRPVRLILSSDDVLHSFFVPAFRIKQDAMPGSYTSLWFTANRTGNTDIFCTEYCGTGHSSMLGTVKIVTEAQFETFLREGVGPRAGETPPQWGARIYQEAACVTCHSTDGSPKTGPTWRGLFGHNVDLNDGTSVMADENYIRESILNPNARVVRGFQPVMPTFRGTLQDRQIDALIAYIRTLH